MDDKDPPRCEVLSALYVKTSDTRGVDRCRPRVPDGRPIPSLTHTLGHLLHRRRSAVPRVPGPNISTSGVREWTLHMRNVPAPSVSVTPWSTTETIPLPLHLLKSPTRPPFCPTPESSESESESRVGGHLDDDRVMGRHRTPTGSSGCPEDVLAGKPRYPARWGRRDVRRSLEVSLQTLAGVYFNSVAYDVSIPKATDSHGGVLVL